MPTPVVTGTPNAVRKGDRIRFDPCRGLVRELHYEHANPAGLVGLANLFLLGRMSYDFEQTVPARIIASASGADLGQPEVTTDNWQILANEMQKSILEGPVALVLDAAVPGALAQVQRNYDEITSTKELLSDLTWTDPTVTSTDLTASQSLLALLLRGTSHFSFAQYVLKHTTNVSQTYAANVADTHIEEIYTTAQLVAECQSGTLWAYPLPGRLRYKIEHIAAPGALTGYTWGWRKLASTETTSANNRIDISSEFWLDHYPTASIGSLPLLYKVYT